MQPLLNIAVRAARAGGDIIARYADRVDTLHIDNKAQNDFVTEVDRLSERAAIDVIRKHYPNHAILAEESGMQGQGDTVWVVDPLDGTTNFLHGVPQYAVSIAVKFKGRLEHGVVYNPISQELFSASRGDGAQLNGRRIRVSDNRRMNHALIGTGFPVQSMANLDVYLEILRAVVQETAGARRAGSAALDLAFVASGRFDGFWEFGLKEWDIAAGILLIREAGGMVCELKGGKDLLRSGNVLAGNPKIFVELNNIVSRCLRRDQSSAAGGRGTGHPM